MKSGDLVKGIASYIWKNDTTVKPGIVAGNFLPGDLAFIINVTHNGVKIITTKGIIGWIDRKESLCEVG